MVYGLTKGQASPTSRPGFKTPIQVNGVTEEPFNPLAVAVALDAPLVARIFIGDKEPSREILKAALQHRGYALVDILQPCVSFNKVNTYQWFKENTYYLESSHDPEDREKAVARAWESEKLPLGIFYRNDQRPVFEAGLAAYRSRRTPLAFREADPARLEAWLNAKI